VAEVWDLGNEKWTRDTATGRFEIASYYGLGPPSREWLATDVGRLVGARLGQIPNPAQAEVFPSSFARSPVTGATLAPATAPDQRTWLPPFGENDSAGIGFLGLPRTAERMVLDLSQYPPEDPGNLSREVGLEPPDTLTLPGAGSYFFVVDRFGLAASVLVTVEYSKGLLFAWAPGSRKWLELTAKNAVLPESSLPREIWGAQLALLGEHEAAALVVPTDTGIAVVSPNLLSLTYSLQLIEGRCTGAPLLIGDRIAVPISSNAGPQQLVLINRKNPGDNRRLDLPQPLLGALGLQFSRALADRRMAVWLSPAGQLVYRPGTTDGGALAYFAWPQGVKPRFEFGAPYLSTTGRLWQLCRNSETGVYSYVQLGQGNPEVQSVQSPRLSTGGTVFHLETQLRGEPWQDTESQDAEASGLLIPLLESVPSHSVLRVRVDEGGAMSTARLLTSRERHRVIFELDGVRDGQPVTTRFHAAHTSRPWLTEPFIYDSRLYLYHPDISSGIPGWTLKRQK
jgi:hypothetical protein